MVEEIKCNRCGSTEWTFQGWNWREGKQDVHRRRCKHCGHVFVLPKNRVADIKITHGKAK